MPAAGKGEEGKAVLSMFSVCCCGRLLSFPKAFQTNREKRLPQEANEELKLLRRHNNAANVCTFSSRQARCSPSADDQKRVYDIPIPILHW